MLKKRKILRKLLFNDKNKKIKTETKIVDDLYTPIELEKENQTKEILLNLNIFIERYNSYDY